MFLILLQTNCLVWGNHLAYAVVVSSFCYNQWNYSPLLKNCHLFHTIFYHLPYALILRPGATALAVSLMIKWLCRWYLYLLQIYLAKRQLSDAVAKRRSGKRNWMYRLIILRWFFVASFFLWQLHIHMNMWLAMSLNWKTEAYDKCQCFLFQDECRVWVERTSDGIVRIKPSQAKLQWCLGILDVLV